MNVSGIRDIQTPSASNMVESTVNRQRSSYAKVIQQMTCPKREQAIVVDSVEGIAVKEYAVAIAKIIGPQNILYISKISNNRVCLYLSSQQLVNHLVETHTQVTIGTKTLEVRPLISKTKRIILSNVHPVIPNSAIEYKLAEFDVNPKSQITYVRAGLNEAGFTHILSFRRQMYINPEDLSKLPSSMQIQHENTVYWVYLSAEKLICFSCKEEGHLAKHCKNTEPNSQVDSQDTTNIIDELPPGDLNQNNNNEQLSEAHTENLQVDDPDQNINKQISYVHAENLQVKMPTKRALSVSTQNDNTDTQSSISGGSGGDQKAVLPTPTKDYIKDKQTLKKPKMQESAADIKIKLNRAEIFFEENNVIPSISIDDLAQFLSETYGSSEIEKISLKYSQNTTQIIDSLKLVYNHIAGNSLKSRVKRILKKLENSATDYNSEGCTSTEE